MRLEFHRWQHHAIFDAKLNIIRQALLWYLAQATLVLPSTAYQALPNFGIPLGEQPMRCSWTLALFVIGR